MAETAGDERDERALLVAAAGGEADAVRYVLDAVGPIVYGFVFARVGGDEAAADDVVQDTFVEAMRSARTFRGDAALSTWMCTIARRRLARHFEAERREALAASGLRLVAGDAEPAEEPALAVDQTDEVIRALGRLLPLHRQVLVLKYLDGCSVAEIAAEVDRTSVQVQSLLQRARARLRAELEGDGD
jgi:RNA polymerase sigma-70 factor (ECF subfamily)